MITDEEQRRLESVEYSSIAAGICFLVLLLAVGAGLVSEGLGVILRD